MPPAIYPLIGLACGVVSGWIWQNLRPGVAAAALLSLILGFVTADEMTLGAVDCLQIGLGVTLAALMAFFGCVAGARVRNSLERKDK